MPVTHTIKTSMKLGGLSFPESRTITADGAIEQSVSHPAAQAGTITTSVITMTATGHTVATGLVDVYWAAGTRLGCDGTTSGVSVTLTGGAGDTLPTGATEVLCTNPTELSVDILGSAIQSIALYSAARGGVVATTDSAAAVLLQQNLALGGTYNWWDGNGDTNPVDGLIGEIYVSHNGTAAATIRVGITYNNA